MSKDINNLKLPPNSIDAEQSVLGGLLLDNSFLDRVSDLIDEHDFYRDEHKVIFKTIVNLIDTELPADSITVFEALKSSNIINKTGGLSYIVGLAQNTPSVANIRRYAEIVRDKSILRKLVTASNEIIESVYAGDKDSIELLDNAERKVLEVAETKHRGLSEFLEIKTVLDQILLRMQEIHDSGYSNSDITGVPTGYYELDKLTSGFQAGDLIIVAGRPAMGKTAFALNIAENIAMNSGLPVGIFSMEMTGSQLVSRMLSSVARVNQQRAKVGNLNEEEWERMFDAFQKLHSAPIHIDESGDLGSYELRSKARRLNRYYGGKLGAIIIDYLQLISSPGNYRSDNRATEISAISRSLKCLAKELNCPVIALSQLSRRVEERVNKRPLMVDLRESGAIEQDADTIIMLYRDEYYNKDSKDKGIADIIVGKQRNGPTGVVSLHFHGEYTRFENLSPQNSFEN